MTSHPHQQGHLHNYILLCAAPTPKSPELFEPLNHGVRLYGTWRCFQVLSNTSIKTTSSTPSFRWPRNYDETVLVTMMMSHVRPLIFHPPILSEGNYTVMLLNVHILLVSDHVWVSKQLYQTFSVSHWFWPKILEFFFFKYGVWDQWLLKTFRSSVWALSSLVFFALATVPSWAVAFKSMLVCFNVFYMMSIIRWGTRIPKVSLMGVEA